jgi:hypothetical protein
MNRTIASPKKNSLNGATFKPASVKIPAFITISVSHLRISFKKVIKMAP